MTRIKKETKYVHKYIYTFSEVDELIIDGFKAITNQQCTVEVIHNKKCYDKIIISAGTGLSFKRNYQLSGIFLNGRIQLIIIIKPLVKNRKLKLFSDFDMYFRIH